MVSLSAVVEFSSKILNFDGLLIVALVFLMQIGQHHQLPIFLKVKNETIELLDIQCVLLFCIWLFSPVTIASDSHFWCSWMRGETYSLITVVVEDSINPAV